MTRNDPDGDPVPDPGPAAPEAGRPLGREVVGDEGVELVRHVCGRHDLGLRQVGPGAVAQTSCRGFVRACNTTPLDLDRAHVL